MSFTTLRFVLAIFAYQTMVCMVQDQQAIEHNSAAQQEAGALEIQILDNPETGALNANVKKMNQKIANQFSIITCILGILENHIPGDKFVSLKGLIDRALELEKEFIGKFIAQPTEQPLQIAKLFTQMREAVIKLQGLISERHDLLGTIKHSDFTRHIKAAKEAIRIKESYPDMDHEVWNKLDLAYSITSEDVTLYQVQLNKSAALLKMITDELVPAFE